MHRLSRLLLGVAVSITMLTTGAPARALEASGFTYTIDGGSTTVTGCASTCPTTLVIPATLGGRSVTGIERDSFPNKRLVSVTIPTSVTTIGLNAFEGNLLTSVTIPNGVTSISSMAFDNNRLTSVTIPSSVTYLSGFGNNQLTSVVIPSGVTTIGSGAFTSNRITSVTIPGTVTTIEDWAFADNKLTTLTIPSSVQSIWDEAFSQNQLTRLTLEDGVTGIGGSAFAYNKISSLVIPGSVRWGMHDGGGAFAANPLTSLTIEDGVTSIPQAAFLQTNLTSVTIPSSVTSIGPYAFGEVETGDPLVTIVFEGDAPAAGRNVFLTPDTASVGSGGSRTATLALFQHVVTAATKRKNLSVMRVWRQPSATGWSSTWSGAQVATIGGSAIATVKPSLRGTSTVGKTLTAVKGTWTGSPMPTIRYQWYACTKAVTAVRTSVPSTCKKITGATRSTFKLTSAQGTKYVTVLVTGTSAGTTPTTWLSKTTTRIK
jgi:hypothetical protein